MRNVRTIRTLVEAGWDCRHWYRDAGIEIDKAADYFAESTETIAGVLAILSPIVAVTTSVRGTVQMLSGNLSPRPGITRQNWANAVAWYHGEREYFREEYRHKRPKTFAFFENLCWVEDTITIDRWILKAFGLPNNRPRNVERVKIESTIRTIATSFEISPAQCQAALWAGILRGNNRNVPTLSLMRELPQ